MKDQVRKAAYLLLLLVILLLAPIYNLLNERGEKAVDLSISVDHAIPFLPIFVFPYILWYGYILFFLVYFCFKDTKIYLRTLLLIVAGEVICFIIYFFFQTTVPRPALDHSQFLHALVLWVYSNDKPVNCFPSIHVLTTFAVMLGSLHIKKKHLVTHLCIHILGSLIIISTLFIKQHVLIDIIGSIFLSTFLYGIFFEVLSYSMAGKREAVSLKNK